MSELRLTAQDGEDLQIIAAYLQDAVLLVKDVAYLPGTRRLALVLNRFCWEEETAATPKGRTHYRARAGLHFDQVTSVKSRNISQENADGVLSLLTLSFEESDAPSGTIVLTFSGGGEMRVDVEALDAHLSDMGARWETPNLPQHDTDNEDTKGTAQ
jgi:DUF2948 family protein